MRFLKYLYLKLIRTNDTPHKIALGFAIGAFYGFLPGLGPFAAFITAVFLKANKAASLAGAFISNTWTILILAPVSLKLGASIFGVDWHALKIELAGLFKNFSMSKLFARDIFYKIILPAAAGYLIVSLILAAAAYLAVFGMIYCYQKAKKARFLRLDKR